MNTELAEILPGPCDFSRRLKSNQVFRFSIFKTIFKILDDPFIPINKDNFLTRYEIFHSDFYCDENHPLTGDKLVMIVCRDCIYLNLIYIEINKVQYFPDLTKYCYLCPFEYFLANRVLRTKKIKSWSPPSSIIDKESGYVRLSKLDEADLWECNEKIYHVTFKNSAISSIREKNTTTRFVCFMRIGRDDYDVYIYTKGHDYKDWVKSNDKLFNITTKEQSYEGFSLFFCSNKSCPARNDHRADYICFHSGTWMCLNTLILEKKHTPCRSLNPPNKRIRII